MSNLDNSTKGILVGVGAAIAVGVGLFALFLSSEDAKEKSKAVINRQRAKHQIRDKFNGNENAENVIDKLSDSEVNNLLSNVNEVDDLSEEVSDTVGNVKDYVSDKTKQVFK